MRVKEQQIVRLFSFSFFLFQSKQEVDRGSAEISWNAGEQIGGNIEEGELRVGLEPSRRNASRQLVVCKGAFFFSFSVFSLFVFVVREKRGDCHSHGPKRKLVKRVSNGAHEVVSLDVNAVKKPTEETTSQKKTKKKKRMTN